MARAGQSELFTVAQDVNPIDASGGLRIHPAYSCRSAPQPNLVVERYLGPDAADATAEYMEYERGPLTIA